MYEIFVTDAQKYVIVIILNELLNSEMHVGNALNGDNFLNNSIVFKIINIYLFKGCM